MFVFFFFSSSRESRNNAEKIRRYKLNTCITQLSQLVPFISNSPKKMEKTAVLRLSAAYLRLSQSKYTYIESAYSLGVFFFFSINQLHFDFINLYIYCCRGFSVLLGLGEQQQELPDKLRNINLARILLSVRIQ